MNRRHSRARGKKNKAPGQRASLGDVPLLSWRPKEEAQALIGGDFELARPLGV